MEAQRGPYSGDRVRPRLPTWASRTRPPGKPAMAPTWPCHARRWRTACDRRELLGLSRSRRGALVLGDDLGQGRPAIARLTFVAERLDGAGGGVFEPHEVVE